ncbi:hypothetical protein SSP24_79540 [Streptomyces spinoverrucosus]|uniref:Uncharacterized protein n=1 Tax=Streptomyces spinoverrucosus TaxID=284043 RepID=A0A4Y3VX60_9ACTN|nr:hypothetical protein SSP24_79540 [Streptomyces spinoverrucosus]GHB81523.1 hypothetical protein GCM10010397_60760 [Streptomyces spinoverrucosus]
MAATAVYGHGVAPITFPTCGFAADAHRATRGAVAARARARRGRTAFAIRATRGLAACQGLSSGTTTSPFRDHTAA